MNIRDRIKELRRVRAGDLLPSPKNWRKHPQAQQDALRGVLAEVGYADALIARELPDGSLELVDGHLRSETTPDMEVPVLVTDLDEHEAAKVLATLDPLAAMAESDGVKLDALLREVQTSNEALAGMLEDLADDAGILDGPQDVVEDEVPEPPADPITKPGDLWLLGVHRVLCGDSTKAEDVERLMGGEAWNVMVTDPPYGVDYTGGRNPHQPPREKLANDMTPEIYKLFIETWLPRRANKGVMYLWFAGRCGRCVYDAVESAGFDVRALLIWNKLDAHYGNFMAQYMQKHEPCLYCVIDSTDWHGPTNEVTVWDIKQPSKNEYHPTQKPVECMARAIKNSSSAGGLVSDPFLGSGTTLIAAEQLNRRCFGMEISPQYCDVIVARWEKLTGKKATLANG